MRVTASIHNSAGNHQLQVSTGGRQTVIQIAGKSTGLGSSVSGGELLLAALATCYCNDVYREAGKMGIEVVRVEVECGAEFPAEGAPAGDVTYSAHIHAKASEAQIRELANRADAAAEIQNTVRAAIPVRLETVTAAAERASD